MFDQLAPELTTLTHRMPFLPAGKHAINIVLASGGYPGKYPKGLPISGLSSAHQAKSYPLVKVRVVTAFVWLVFPLCTSDQKLTRNTR